MLRAVNIVDVILPTFRRVHPWLYERTNGTVGHRLGIFRVVLTLLLYTTGRKSGQRRTSPLAYAPDGDGWIVVASNNGSDRPPAWLLNLEADPSAEVRVGNRVVPVRAEIFRPGEPGHERVWGVVNAANQERFRRYQQRTQRPIPVVRLAPVTAPA